MDGQNTYGIHASGFWSGTIALCLQESSMSERQSQSDRDCCLAYRTVP